MLCIVTDVSLQPISVQNHPKRHRKYAALPRVGLYRVKRKRLGAISLRRRSVLYGWKKQRQQRWNNWIVITLRLQPDGSGHQPASRQVMSAEFLGRRFDRLCANEAY